MQEKSQFCPNCQGKLMILKSGQTVCRYCGERGDKNDTGEESKNQNYEEIINKLFPPSIMVVIGECIMLFTLFFYDTTVCYNNNGSISCTHDIGLLNNKSNLITIGGFLFLGGCVLSKNQDEKSKK